MKVDVIVPALDRPARALPLVESLRASVTAEEAEVHEVFVCTDGDTPELDELARHEINHMILAGPRERGDYARKINRAARISKADWFLLGADDLRFHPGWLTECLDVHERTGAVVIGTNDMGNALVRAGRHATHSLVHRGYLEQGTIDEPGLLLHEGYDHNSVDVEFVQTAMHRGVWAFAQRARIEHLHPLWRKGTTDSTYALGQRSYHEDAQLCRERARLWGGGGVSSGVRRKITAI